MIKNKMLEHIRIDERNHVEKPLLDQLAGLGWEIIDLDSKQYPQDSYRKSFTEVVMLQVLREQLKVINPWLEDDQVEEVVKRLTAGFPGTGLIQNNSYVLDLLLGNTSVSENRQTGDKSPTVRFVDFEHRDNNRFIAVCQFKVRILGTEHHIIPDIVLFLNGLPVVVIECKSPKVKDAIPEAIDQILRYSEQRGAKGEGCAHLFYYNQFVIITGQIPTLPAVAGHPAFGQKRFALLFEFFRSAETEIRISPGYQLFRVLPVKIQSLALPVRTVPASYSVSLIPIKANPAKVINNRITRLIQRPGNVCVLYSKDHFPVVASCKKPVKQACANIPDMEMPCRRRCKPNPYLFRHSFTFMSLIALFSHR
jgi:hypothetical protein